MDPVTTAVAVIVVAIAMTNPVMGSERLALAIIAVPTFDRWLTRRNPLPG
jgi:hypothetical protein